MASLLPKLTVIPKLEQLSERVIRVLGCNPGPFTLQGTNTYLIGTGDRKILIDASDPKVPEYVEVLRSALEKFRCSIQEIIVTHWHPDHVGGVPDVFREVIKSEKVRVSKFKRIASPDVNLGPNIPYTFINNNHVFKTEGATLRAVYTPGHTDDHMMLYLEEENALFSGDNVLGEGTTVFEDLHSYMSSLNKALEFKPSIIYPSHGPVVNDPIERVTDYIKHRNQREEQIIAALQENSESALSSMDLVDIIYVGINPAVKSAANKNVILHLNKLVKDDIIECVEVDGKKWKIRWKSCKI